MALVADEFKGADDTRHFVKVKRNYSIISTRTYNTKDFTPQVDPFVEIIMEKGIEITILESCVPNQSSGD